MITNLTRALRGKSKTFTARRCVKISSDLKTGAFHAIKLETVAGPMKLIFLVFLLTFPGHSMAAWVEYTTRANGDVFFFDDARVQKNGNHIRVWNRVRYKSSLMGASSYQSFLRIDCSEYSQTTLQSTFFSDKNWSVPAMATNMKEKPKKTITANSALERLANILCKK